MEDGPDPAPSSRSVHGSISVSGSGCDEGMDDTCVGGGMGLVGFVGPFEVARDGMFRMVPEAGTGTGGWREVTADKGMFGGWQEIVNFKEGKTNGIAVCIRHLTASGSCMLSSSFCTIFFNQYININIYL